MFLNNVLLQGFTISLSERFIKLKTLDRALRFGNSNCVCAYTAIARHRFMNTGIISPPNMTLKCGDLSIKSITDIPCTKRSPLSGRIWQETIPSKCRFVPTECQFTVRWTSYKWPCTPLMQSHGLARCKKIPRRLIAVLTPDMCRLHAAS